MLTLFHRTLVGSIIVFCCASLALFAQSTNNQQISGQVTDSSGSAVPNATVKIVNLDTDLTRTAPTNESGNYVVSNLPIGRYAVSVEAQGFKKYIVNNVELTVDSKLAVNPKLEVGAISDSITVQADSAQIDTTSGEIGRLISGEEATQIQLNGRNFPQLLALVPGVSTTYSSGFGLFGGYGVTNSSQSANGGRTDTFSWNLDGVDNKDNGGGGNNFVNINPDAIAEFKMLTTNYSAEYGNSAGGVVNLAIKSGTKQFHGGVYEYFRNDAIQARAFNALSKPELRYNNFGWTLGGPILIPKVNSLKDKLYFFIGGDYKRLRSGTVNTWTVPTVVQRGGDFSALARGPNDPTTGAPFPGGIIPVNRFSPNTLRLINNYPVPNFTGSGGNYVFTTVQPLNTNQWIYKADYNFSPKSQFSWHYVHDYYTSQQNQTQLIEYNRNIPGVNTSLQWTYVPSPTMVNTMIGSFSGNVIKEKTGIVPNALFIKDYTRTGEGFTAPSIFNASSAIPTLGIAGYTSLTSTPLNFDNFNRIFDFKDDLSKILGNHTFKVGIDMKRSRKNQDNVPAINGTFAFNTTRTGTTNNALADALLGNFYTYTEASSLRQGWYRFTQIEPYVQDDWKVSKRLTLNLGLRYQYMPPQYSALNNTSAFLPQYFNSAQAAVIDPKTGAIISAQNPYNGLVLGGSGFPATAKGRVTQYADPAVQALFHNLPQGTANTDWKTWSPRVGFAYDLTGAGKTVLRGGFGVFYERIEGNYLFSAVNNVPFIQQDLIYNGNLENPTSGALQNFPQNITNSHYLDMKVPRVLNWSLGVQHKITSSMMIDMAYVGSSAANLAYQDDINQLPAGTLTAHPGINVNALRPFPGYGDIYQFNTGANFIYNSLQMSFKKQFKEGGQFSIAYTYAHARTDANAYNYQPMDSYNLRGDWGPSSYNRNNVFVASYVYPLPFWRHSQEMYKRVLGGWQISGVTTLQTGLPLNVTLASDIAGTGIANQRVNLIGDPRAGVTGTQYLNPAAFAVPTPGTLGNYPAYSVFGPPTKNWDASLQKAFPIGEHLHADFRVEVYDFPNHLSFFNVNTGSFSATPPSSFGQVSSATDPRTLQLAIRLNF